MKPIGLSKQIIIIALLPALLISIVLSVFFTYDQLSFISNAQNKYGHFVIHQIQPLAEKALNENRTDELRSTLQSIVDNDSISYLRLSDEQNTDIITIDDIDGRKAATHGLLHSLLENRQYLTFQQPIDHQYTLPDGTTFSETIANIEIKLNTHQATLDKIEYIIRGGTITLILLLLLSLFILKFSRDIISPIKSLTRSVRKITAGDLDSRVELRSTGELGLLESCIDHMRNELKNSQTDLEIQLSVYTEELQQTLEELEIRNAELDITRSKAIYANNAKSEFLANMSHEIRTPLSGIIGFTELLQDTSLSDQQKDYANTIQKSSRSLLEIINDILDLSKIESGKTEISTSEFNLIDIIEDIVNLLTPTALTKDIELFYRIDKDVPATIQADPFRIHQVLTNLIGNAIKFTDTGYVYLQVTPDEVNGNEFSIKFSISDTGIGMSTEDKKKLFRAFTQADTSITRRFGGTGLGLVISRKLTLLMKGEIGFDSTEGEGSTFWFSIPVTPVPTQLAKSDLSGSRIAFINDHFIAKQAFRALFTSTDVNVMEYSLDDLDDTTSIEHGCDAIVLFLSRKDMGNESTLSRISQLKFNKPSLLIASTRSHTRLRSLQQHIFDNAVFASEKSERIKQKLLSTINRGSSEVQTDDIKENAEQHSDWSAISVMVVDDNDINLRLAEILLNKHKTQVTTAMTGTQAIDYASLNSYDLIFMDLHMPGLDGYETTRRIRESAPGKQPVIIALTANALPQEKEKVTQAGINGIIIKPVSDVLLQKVINQWVLKESFSTSEFVEIMTGTGNKHGEIETSRGDPQNIFSLDLAKEFTGDNEELAYELFHMLRAELDSYRDAIKDATARSDMSALREQVHKLHGASRCCGTTELKDISSNIEKLIDKNIDFDLQREVSALLDAIQNVADVEIDDDRSHASG